MSKRKPSAYVNDILTCIDHIESYTSNLSFQEFSKNYMAIDACLYFFWVSFGFVSDFQKNPERNPKEA